MNKENTPTPNTQPVENKIPTENTNPNKPVGNKNSGTVPMIIGAVILALLVIIVLIAFFSAYSFRVVTEKEFELNDVASDKSEQFIFQAQVTYLTGSAWKIVDGRKIEIKEQDILKENDEIETEENSRLVFEIDDGSIIRVAENSKIKLTEMKSDKILIEEEKGVVFSRVNKDKNHQYIVQAGEVTVESMGTVFSVENEDDVKVKVFESEVKVKDQHDKEITVEEEKQWQEGEDVAGEMDTSEVSDNEFLSWSLEEEKIVQPTVAPTIKPTTAPKPVSSSSAISLSGSTTGASVSLSWKVSGIETPHGFKVVKNTSGSPVFPGDSYQYLSDPGTRSYKWNIGESKTYYFRVCQYLGNEKCGVYSNEITVTTTGSSSDSSGSVSSINLSANKKSSDRVELNWTVSGNAPKGFKVVWSEHSGPTYPTRSDKGDKFFYRYEPGDRDYTVSGLKAGKAYHFRVCEYLDKKCGKYSNEVSVGM